MRKGKTWYYGIVACMAAVFVMTCGQLTSNVLAVEPLERVTVNSATLVSSIGEPVGTKITTNQQVLIKAEMVNNQDEKQVFVYISQIKDSDGRVVFLKWQGNSLGAHGTSSTATQWNPQEVGRYTIEVFVWDSLTNQSPLTGISTLEITVG